MRKFQFLSIFLLVTILWGATSWDLLNLEGDSEVLEDFVSPSGVKSTNSIEYTGDGGAVDSRIAGLWVARFADFDKYCGVSQGAILIDDKGYAKIIANYEYSNQFELIEGKINATVVTGSSIDSKLPFGIGWYGEYSVIKGTFTIEGVDRYGKSASVKGWYSFNDRTASKGTHYLYINTVGGGGTFQIDGDNVNEVYHCRDEFCPL